MTPRAARTGLKAALASAGAVALLSTGAAFAATGHAPWSNGPTPASAAATADHTMPTHPTRPSHSVPTDDPSQRAGGPDAHAMWGLCRAYQAGAKATHGRALQSPAFVALELAAGGADQVATYCATLPTPGGADAAPSQPAHPTHPTHPTHPAKPTQAASPTHPTHPAHPAPPSHPAPSHQTPSHPRSSSHPLPPSHPSPDSHSTARSHP